MFLHLSVILFTGGGVCLSVCWDTHPLSADTPSQCMLGYGQQVGGTHPAGMQSCSGWIHSEGFVTPIVYLH